MNLKEYFSKTLRRIKKDHETFGKPVNCLILRVSLQEMELKTSKKNKKYLVGRVCSWENYKQGSEWKTKYSHYRFFILNENRAKEFFKNYKKSDKFYTIAKVSIDNWEKDGKWNTMAKIESFNEIFIKSKEDKNESNNLENDIVFDESDMSQPIDFDDDIPF